MAEFEPPPGFERVPAFTPPPGFEPVAPPSSIIEKAKAGAQVGVASAAKGATEAMGVPAMILGMGGPNPSLTIRLADWARKQFGMDPIPEENKKEYERIAGSMRVEPEKGVKTAFERAGVSTDPEAEAKRLNVPFGGDTLAGQAIKAASQATRYGTSAALTGAGPLLSAGTAVGAGAGEAIGGELGAALGALLGGPAALKLAPKTGGTTADLLFQKADKLYKIADSSPPLSSAQMNALDANVTAFLSLTRRTGSGLPAFDPSAHPGTASGLAALKEYAAKPQVTMPEFFTLRDRVRDGFNIAKDGKDRKLLSQVLDRLESFLPAEAKAADVAFRTASRSDAITELQKLADRRPTEDVSALRTEVTKLLNSKARMRYFSEDEANRLDQIVADPLFNKLRRVGAYAPSRGPVSLIADMGPAALGGAAGSLKEGMAVSSAMALGGEAARRAAGIRLRTMLRDFADEIRNGRTAPRPYLQGTIRTIPGVLSQQDSGSVE